MELEALRIDIMEGMAEQVLPQVEVLLAQVALWWQRLREGEAVPEAPDMEALARTYIGALDIATDADFAGEDWHSALRHITSILALKRELQRPPEDIAGDRMNLANVLRKLQRFDEARRELESCLQLFAHNTAMKASVLGSLASLFNDQDDIAQAIWQQRLALALFEDLPAPAERAISHNNLARYLTRSASAPALEEARWHQLAALTYRLASGLGQDLQTSLHNYANAFRRARANASEPAIPRLSELLARPEFQPLTRWLVQREIAPADLQAAIDDFLAQARQKSLADDDAKPN